MTTKFRVGDVVTTIAPFVIHYGRNDPKEFDQPGWDPLQRSLCGACLQ